MKLIDADNLIKLTQKDMEFAFNNGFLDMAFEREHLIKVIRNQPTAYSVDKVVEELESFAKLAEDRWTNGTSKRAYQEHKCWVKAIEIVKQGGVSDDVCEWKYNYSEYYFESSCDHLHIFMSDGPKENGYRYCPYCGKKIKVVE